MTLEQIVLPLEQSRSLVEHGIVLETAMYWQRSTMHKDHPVSVHVRGDNEILNIEDFFEDICPAPVLSELLDAIRAKVGDAEFHSYNVNTVIDIGNRTWEVLGDYIGVARRYKIVERAPALTDLLAAAALLMEVSK